MTYPNLLAKDGCAIKSASYFELRESGKLLPITFSYRVRLA
jgi:hypothetical protein